MRHKIPSLLVGLSIGWGTPMLAQQPEWVTHLLTAAQLPVTTAEARREGLKSDEIRAALDAMAKGGVPAYDATAVIDTARAARREGGPVDNFGAFVQSQLAAGKRGPALAAAIRAEHVRQGKGNAARGAPGQSRGKDSTLSDSARGHGRSKAKPSGGPMATKQTHDTRGRGRPAPVKPHR